MKRDFNEWLSKFRPSIAPYEYYVDFKKIHKNVDSIKVELNILNALIGSKDIENEFISIELNILNALVGSKDIENEFISIVTKYPETLKCVPLLIAIRYSEIHIRENDTDFCYDFENMNYSVEQYAVFMRKILQEWKRDLIQTQEKIVAVI